MCPIEFGDVRRFDTLGSTNTYLLDQARQGAPEGTAAVADHQSAGRGRLGRSWEAPPGTSLLVSLLIRPRLSPDELPLVTLAVALAAADSCGVVAGVSPLLKWPNDLIVGEKKLAGILAEVDPGAPGGPKDSIAVVVGIGLNVDWPGPPGVGGTSLTEAAGRRIDREKLLASYLGGVGGRLDELSTEDGRRNLVDEARDRCATLGRQVRVDVSGRSVTGTATAMADDGRLLVETGDGVCAIAAGDVIHLRATPSASA